MSYERRVPTGYNATGAAAIYQLDDNVALLTRLYAAKPAVTKRGGRVVTPARPAEAEVLLSLPLTLRTSDPERLRAEAALLCAAADELEEMHRGVDERVPVNEGSA